MALAQPGDTLLYLLLPRLPRPRFGLPSRLDLWSFVQGMTLDGLFVLGMSVLAAAAVPDYAALAAGAALALGYIAEILLGPAGGALAERQGRAGC